MTQRPGYTRLVRRTLKLGAGCLTTVMLLLAAAPWQAELLSKRYRFQDGVRLSIGESTGSGLRLDSVRFKVPAPRDDVLTRTGGLVQVEVAVSNTGGGSVKVGLAVALFDDEERLLAVARGGSKLVTVKSGRQKTFRLLFDGVNAEAHKATVFQISVESKP